MKKYLPHFLAFLFLFSLLSSLLWLAPNHVSAAVPFDPSGNLKKTGLGSKTPEDVTISIINVALGFLSLLALILILWAGFSWMLSAGNSEKIKKASGVLIAAVIGLLIILAAYGIANYVFDQINRATG